MQKLTGCAGLGRVAVLWLLLSRLRRIARRSSRPDRFGGPVAVGARLHDESIRRIGRQVKQLQIGRVGSRDRHCSPVDGRVAVSAVVDVKTGSSRTRRRRRVWRVDLYSCVPAMTCMYVCMSVLYIWLSTSG